MVEGSRVEIACGRTRKMVYRRRCGLVERLGLFPWFRTKRESRLGGRGFLSPGQRRKGEGLTTYVELIWDLTNSTHFSSSTFGD